MQIEQTMRTLSLELDERMQEDIVWLTENHDFESDEALFKAALAALRENFSRLREARLNREELARQTNTSRDDFG